MELGAVSVAGKVFNRLKIENKDELPYNVALELRNFEQQNYAESKNNKIYAL